LAGEPGVEEITKEAMITIPAALLVQRNEKEVVLF
jgi:hypothetical protein